MTGTLAKIGRLGRLSWRDLGLLGRTALLLILTRLVFLCLPYSVIGKHLRRLLAAQGRQIIGRDPQAWRILWAVEALSRNLPKINHCLTKAVVAKKLLNRQGYAVDLQIGVHRSSQGKFEAHAWLESEGLVVMGYLNDLDRYKSFPSVNCNVLRS